ncbi:MAG: ABC transporter ATP-binding protein [Alphaproteobacteria bacterium]
MLEITNLEVAYGSHRVLADISLTASPGTVTGIVGPNGAGKSTLLSAIMGLHPYHGVVRFEGTEFRAANRRDWAHRVSYLPQGSTARSSLTVLEAVLLGRMETLGFRVSRRELDRAHAALEAIGLESLARRRLGELSGGQRQLVFIAQALSRSPSLMILDEPTNTLDLRNQLEILGLLRDRATRHNLTVVTVIHDLNLAARFSDALAVLDKGRIAAYGRPTEVMTPSLLETVFGVEARLIPLDATTTHFVAMKARTQGAGRRDDR